MNRFLSQGTVGGVGVVEGLPRIFCFLEFVLGTHSDGLLTQGDAPALTHLWFNCALLAAEVYFA